MSWAKNCLIARLEGHSLINGFCPAGSQQWGQPCRGQFCGHVNQHLASDLDKDVRLHDNWLTDDIKLGGWDGMPNGKASTRRTLLSSRTGPGNTPWGSIEVKRSGPGAKKSHVLGSDVWAAALPKTSRHLQKVPGCKTASGALSLQHGILSSALHGQGMGKTHPISLSAMKWHRLTKNYNLDRSPYTYSLKKQHKIFHYVCQC